MKFAYIDNEIINSLSPFRTPELSVTFLFLKASSPNWPCSAHEIREVYPLVQNHRCFSSKQQQNKTTPIYVASASIDTLTRYHCIWMVLVNSSLPGQNGRHFTDDFFKCIFLNAKFCILIQISMKFVPRGWFGNKWALVQIMAWRRTGDEPLSEPMLTQFTDAYIWH